MNIAISHSPVAMTPEEIRDYNEVRQEAQDLLDDPDLWLETPHDLLAGKKPRDLIIHKKKQVVLDLLGAIRHGMFT
jgi:uncharacterized protein (DUF2384 family)